MTFKEYLLEKRKKKTKKKKLSSFKRSRPYGIWGYPWMGIYGTGVDGGAGSSDGGGGGGES